MAAPPVAAAAKPEQAGETILLVEDESNLRGLVRECLEKQGYTVLEAGDGTAALQVTQGYAAPIHLLLTDVVMPGINGRELAMRIASLRPDIKVLYMSGYTEEAIGREADAEIILLQKPFSLTLLKEKVREALHNRGPQDWLAPPSRAEQAIRAQRFNVRVPLKYRLLGEGDWRAGTTVNISRSGMLFRAEELFPVHSELEIDLVIPWQIAGLSPTEVICRGQVVRVLEGDQFRAAPALAAKILRYQFQVLPQRTQA
jgi:CheY-like chemotaxis protein